MKPTKTNRQQDLTFQGRISQQIDLNHELCVLSTFIDWESFENAFSGLFEEKIGAPAKPVRLVVGMLMLEYMYGRSDDEGVDRKPLLAIFLWL